jgi:toxin ParE1/3/4
MDHRVVFAPEAQADLVRIARRSPAADLARIEAWCEGLADEPERGTRRDDLFPGLRVLGFEGRVAVAFHIGLDTVTIDRIVSGGR